MRVRRELWGLLLYASGVVALAAFVAAPQTTSQRAVLLEALGWLLAVVAGYAFAKLTE